MERTPQEMPLQLTPNPLKNLVFLKEVFQLGVSISSRSRYDRFDTAAYLIRKKMLRNASEKGEKSRREKAKNCSLLIPRKP